MYYFECLECGVRFISSGYSGTCERCGGAVQNLVVGRE
jgi:Zn finger protein HypA/HybF involved in hydrogenase expression